MLAAVDKVKKRAIAKLRSGTLSHDGDTSCDAKVEQIRRRMDELDS